MFVNPKRVLSSELKCMLIEVVITDFIDIVSAGMLSSKSKLESESFCLMVLIISTNSYTPAVNSISTKSLSNPNSGIIIVVLSLIL